MKRASDRKRALPPTRVPATPYARPTPVAPRTLRLDGNEGSVPPSALVESLATLEPSSLRDYPDVGELTEAIADRHGLLPEQVVVTTGADDAIDRIFRAFARPGDELLLPVPTFEMIHRFATIAGISTVSRPWLGDFPLAELTAAASDRTTMVAVVSPNNPTGAVVSRAELQSLAEACPGSVLIFDHVYAEYADEDLTAAALEIPNTVVLRTFSKAWGLAGCRVGYALASRGLAAILRNAANPYPVATPAAFLALERLRGGGAEMAAHVAQVRSERERLTVWLARRGIGCQESQGNFLLAELGPKAAQLRQRLAELGVLVRAFPHRTEIASAVRISLPGDEGGFDRLLETLGTVFSETPGLDDDAQETGEPR